MNFLRVDGFRACYIAKQTFILFLKPLLDGNDFLFDENKFFQDTQMVLLVEILAVLIRAY